MKMEGAVPPPSSMPPHPQPPSQSLVQRYKYIWRFLLISNLALGAYMFASARKKEKSVVARKIESEVAPPPEPVSEPSPPPPEDILISPPPPEEIVISPPITEPVIERDPIPTYQQQELFKWMLEEKRKIKPNNREEKKRIDKEKALLKHYIRSNLVPSI